MPKLMVKEDYAEYRVATIPVPEEVVEKYKNMVFKLAVGYSIGKTMHSHLDDMYQEGLLGLMYAYRTYSASRNCALSSHINIWARSYMMKYLAQYASIVKIGKDSSDRSRAFWKGELPCDYSLDYVSGEFDGVTFLGRIPDYTTPEGLFEREEINYLIRKKVQRRLKGLSGLDRAILVKRLWAEEPLKLRELAEEFKVSTAWVNECSIRLRKRLKKSLSRSGVRVLLGGEIIVEKRRR